ncbi:hypothetical protein FRB96_001721 [Tulasnella sp. 330]|nr:hypothetical protein FRB96_001721 [Tulasnella sp. 330]KAG8886818.1 hypothetical protein FRB98_000954 [Tulasnella sp. 332]
MSNPMMYEKPQPDYGQQNVLQQQQPGFAPNMNAAQGGGNRNVLNKPYNGQGERDWSYGICDCTGDMDLSRTVARHAGADAGPMDASRVGLGSVGSSRSALVVMFDVATGLKAVSAATCSHHGAVTLAQ